MMAKVLSVAAALLLLLLSVSVMLGWFLHIPTLVQVFPGFVGMVFNSASLFALIGITILIANYFPWQRYKFVMQMVGVFIVLYAALSLTQDIFQYSLGIDEWVIKSWLHDPNPAPGRMAPNSTISFILSGVVIFLLPFHQKKIINHLILVLIFIILIAALIGVLIYGLKLEFVFSWYHFTRMALHTAIGFILVSIALWCLLIQSPYFIHLYEGREERKILLLSGVVLVTLTLITGLGSIAIITYSSFNLIQQFFKTSMLNKIAIFETEIKNIEKTIRKLTHDQNFQKNVLTAIQNDTPSVRQAFALIFADDDLSIKIISNGKILYAQGQFVEKPNVILPFKATFNSYLFWQDGYGLLIRTPIYANGKIIAELWAESALPNINKFYLHDPTLGKSGENIICTYVTKKQVQCLPGGINKNAFTVDFSKRDFVPMYYALNGMTGADNILDYRQRRVIAAYSPIGQTGLGLVVEKDAEEIYQPVNKLLLIIFPAAFLLILIGLLLLRWQVVPLVRKVISSEKEATKNKLEFERSEQRYKIAVNSSNTGLWDWKKDTDYFYASDLFKKMLGYTQDEFPNSLETFLDHIHPEDKERIANLFTNETLPKQNFNVEYRVRTKSGEYGWYQTIGQVIVDDLGKPKGMAGSLLDINERKKIDGMKNEFISVVSHELRTPLTSIRGALCLMLGGSVGNFTDKATNLLEIANINCERLINLINAILDVEKITSGKIELQLKPISISKVVKDAIEANQMYAHKFSVTMQLVTDLPDVIVNVDYERLIQVLNNLLSNAIKFSPSNEEVSISLTHKNDRVRVTISDKGKGISEEFKNRLFQKFSQEDSSSTRKVSGTGLGLNIAKSIIELMQGTIGFYNNKIQGATFYFELPIFKMD